MGSFKFFYVEVIWQKQILVNVNTITQVDFEKNILHGYERV